MDSVKLTSELNIVSDEQYTLKSICLNGQFSSKSLSSQFRGNHVKFLPSNSCLHFHMLTSFNLSTKISNGGHHALLEFIFLKINNKTPSVIFTTFQMIYCDG